MASEQEQQKLRATMQRLETDALYLIFTRDARHYTDEAREAARDEMKARGYTELPSAEMPILTEQINGAAESQPADEQERQARSGISMWTMLWVVAFLVKIIAAFFR